MEETTQWVALSDVIEGLMSISFKGKGILCSNKGISEISWVFFR